MTSAKRWYRPKVERLEDRAVPAFLAPVTALDGGARAIVADFNHDGRDDVAVIRGQAVGHSAFEMTFERVFFSGRSMVEVRLSNGDGTFQMPEALRGKGEFLTAYNAGDINGDGHQDVVVSTFTRISPCRRCGGNDLDSTLYGTGYDNVWLGKGDGTFRPVQTTSYPVADRGYVKLIDLLNTQEVIADLNGDGIGDRATVNGSTSVVSVALGRPNGSYEPPQSYVAGPSPGWIVAGEFDGDGQVDLLVINSLYSEQPTLSVLLNDGNW